jgi:outer membrane protein TolC
MSPAFDVFKSGTDWYKSSAIGLTVSLPIFSGFQKISKVSQSDLGIKEAEESIRLKEQAIHLEVSNVEIQYTTAINNIRTERDNLTLAERVYRNTQLEYQQGSGSSLELIQSESSLRETQNNYYTRLLELYTARLDREKARGTLTEFINQIQ